MQWIVATKSIGIYISDDVLMEANKVLASAHAHGQPGKSKKKKQKKKNPKRECNIKYLMFHNYYIIFKHVFSETKTKKKPKAQ